VKRTIVIGLIISLGLPFVGSWVWLDYQKNQVRRTVKHRIMEGLPKEVLTALSFTIDQSSALKWKHSKEFEFQGHMYDVVYTESSNGRMTYWCWHDKEETHFNKQIQDLIASEWMHRPDRLPQQKNLAKIWNIKPIVPQRIQISPQNTLIFNSNHVTKFERILPLFLDFDSPPPEC
jgi:hypothetical protein